MFKHQLSLKTSQTLANELDVEEVFNIGDRQQTRTIMAAIWDGYEVGRSL